MALYFVGVEDMNDRRSGLFYLDPHYVQKAIPRSDIVKETHSGSMDQYLTQYHCRTLRSLSLNEMCTSLAPGFYLRDKDDFTEWKQLILAMKNKFTEDFIFSVYEKKPNFMRMSENTKPSTSKENFDTGSDNSFEDLGTFNDKPPIREVIDIDGF